MAFSLKVFTFFITIQPNPGSDFENSVSAFLTSAGSFPALVFYLSSFSQQLHCLGCQKEKKHQASGTAWLNIVKLIRAMAV